MKCNLVISDEVNVRFENLDAGTRRKLVSELEYFVPGARYSPQVRLGRWNGKASFADIGGRTYLNLLDRLLPIVQNAGYEIEIDDRRQSNIQFEFDEVTEDSYSHIVWPEGHQFAGTSIKINNHQIEMINAYLANTQCINIIPTAGGKTLITGILSHKIEKYGRSIVIVPNKDLVVQTESDYKNLGLDVGVYFGDRKDWNKTHTICTWQSLESLAKHDKENDETKLKDFIEDVVCVMCDETHRVTGKVLRSLLGGPFANIPIRWGLTGTMPEEEQDKLAVISCIGKQTFEIKTKDLQDLGILAKININVWQLQDLGEIFNTYQEEVKYLTSNKIRMKFLASKIEEISKSGNTLVLVDRIETGKLLESLIPDSVFVSGKMKSKDRRAEYAEVQTVDNKVIIATSAIAATGTNIPRLFNLMLLECGKSWIRVVQSLGRGLRIAEDKDHIEVYDVCSNSKYSKRHLTKRKQFYKDKEYPFSITKVIY